jgi:hypothetical protein
MRRITAAAVIVAPVLFLVVNIMHPKEYTRNHEAQQIQSIAHNYTRWQLAHFLTFIAIMIFALVVCGLAWILYKRLPGMAILGAVLGIWGLIALGGVLALDGFTWGAIGQVSTWPTADYHTTELALMAVQQAKWGYPFYAGALLWIAGLLILTIGLIRTHLIPTVIGWVFALGVVLVGIEGAVENNTYFIVAAAVLAIGGVGVGLALRHDDSESTSIGNVQPA